MKIKKYLFPAFSFWVMLFFGCEGNDNYITIRYQPVDSADSKKVLLEFFTNSGCTPCVAAHNYLDGIEALNGVTINDSNVIILSYHTKYPYIYDSLYMANITQNDARSSYYGVNYTPQARLDGVNIGQFSAMDWTAQINTELVANNYMDISLTVNYDSLNRTGFITAIFNVLLNLPTNDNVVHVIITESNISYVTAPNGITNFDDVMRNMITGTNGDPISLSQGGNQSIIKQFTLNSAWNAGECFITVFIQNSTTKAVYGVERIKITN